MIRPRKLLCERLTREVIGAFYDTYRELGFGFSESICAEALAIVLHERSIRFDREASVLVSFRHRTVGVLRPDFVVDGSLILEIKSVRQLEARHDAQLLNYLRATPIEVGLLLNFGQTPEFRRFVFANERKGRARVLRDERDPAGSGPTS
jgi:GxxExxY protein